MLKAITSMLSASPIFREAFAAPKPGVTAFYDMSEGQRAFLAAALAQETGRQVLLVTSSDASAMKAADDCGVWLHGKAAMLPATDVNFTRGTASQDTLYRRLSVLHQAHRGDIQVICVPADALMTRVMPVEQWDALQIRLSRGDEMEPAELIAALVKMGYQRVDMVEGKGQCALRGSIVDAFSPSETNATRIEFFDTEVDTIRAFDPISQRSVQDCEEVSFVPAVEWVIASEQAETMRALVQNQKRRLYHLSAENKPADEQPADIPSAYITGISRLFQDVEAVQAGMQLPQLHLWSGALEAESSWIWEYLKEPILLLDEPEKVHQRWQDRQDGFAEDFKIVLERQEAVPEQGLILLDWADFSAASAHLPVMTMQEFLRGQGELSPSKIVKFPGLNASKYASHFKDLAADINVWREDHRTILLAAGGDARSQRLQAALQEQELFVPIWDGEKPIQAGDVLIWRESMSRGFVLEEEKLVIIGDGDLFGAGYRRTKAHKTSGEKIQAFTDLKVGDVVVHEYNGIGIFQGITRIQSEGAYRDYLLIQYAGTDKLYVPTEQFDRVQKYIGSADSVPPLNSLSGNSWVKKKNKVRESLKKLAFDLVQLYAARQATPGFAFSPDSVWTREFADSFPYELTPDQEAAVEDISRDMEAPTNMDRLLCGDVGYGKTEVALRAAMKAVLDNKQVALLAPTTILAQQHYYTIIKRFEQFPVTVDVLSRFRSPSMQKKTIQNVAEGKVDILVGTHRLLSKDVHFKDLGLLIVDEEQRFGVGHKETIKNLKKTVDVLTLSATPIPRTLHMSMVGVRDMSLLQTPPEERYPVQTYVLDYNGAVIRDAIMRELAREGQVYFLYNHVQHIDEFFSHLRALVPEARIGVAHGQMKESQLEDVMLDFYNNQYDVLLCSTIIESGLDVPKANTIIVYDADRFGLSQLYQLRGRVGRSNRIAYAYFTIRPDKMLSETAQQRLAAIREFTAFGSGFRIAMRDLEIRGAGNIFGPEQSGKVADVGYDLYCHLIEEAVEQVRAEQGEPVPVRVETKVDLQVDAYLPESYVQGTDQRLEIYKRIAMIHNRQDREEVLEELVDRFGDVPPQVVNLIDIGHLRGVCQGMGINHVSRTLDTVVFRLQEGAIPELDQLYQAITSVDNRLFLTNGTKPALLFRAGNKMAVLTMLKTVLPIMEKVAAACGR